MASTPETARVGFDDRLFKAYEDGKHRRYSLLFSVNGGSFAVAKLLDARGTPDVGSLTMGRLALGMTVFTLVMSIDIGTFGWKMRKLWKASVSDDQTIAMWDGYFALQGRLVLASLWLLLSVGWLLAGDLL